MFTGLIETQGVVKAIESSQFGKKITVISSLSSDDTLCIGDSIAINGACHTIVSKTRESFIVETMNETLRKTNLSKLSINSKVNLERAMKADGRFDGHFVSGHIDGIAKLISKKQDGFSFVYRFNYETRYIVQKGSICINGVSLTISNVGDDFFEVSLIPHTISNTNLAELKINDEVNIEVDMLAKYIEKFVNLKSCDTKIDLEFLKENGF